jgi:hypothetical protein
MKSNQPRLSSQQTWDKTGKLIGFAYISFFFCWLIALVISLSSMVQDRSAFFLIMGSHTMRADFVGFYELGKISLSEDRLHPYDEQVQLNWLNKIASPITFTHPPHIQYVPFVFPLMAPFSRLALEPAYVLWTLFNLGVAVFGMTLLMRATPGFTGKRLISFLIVVMASQPSFAALRSGQSTYILIGCVAVFYWALLRLEATSRDANDKLGRWLTNASGGLAAALSTIKPQYVLTWFLPAAARSKIILISMAFACEIGLLAWASANLGIDNVIHYPDFVLNIEHSGFRHGVDADKMTCLRGILTVLLGDAAGFEAAAVLFFLSAIAIFLLWRGTAKKDERSLRWMIAVAQIWQVLFSLHAFDYDCLLVAIAAIVTLPDLALAGDNSCLKVWTWGLLIYPIAGWMQFFLIFGLHAPVYCQWISTFWLICLLVAGINVLYGFRAPAQELSSAGGSELTD